MNLGDYIKSVKFTSPDDTNWFDELNIAALGVTGEAGEFANGLKKVIYHGHPMNLDELTDEMGDVLFYVMRYCMRVAKISPYELMDRNHRKRIARYPNGFSSEYSIKREK